MQPFDFLSAQKSALQKRMRSFVRACKPRSFRTLFLTSILLVVWIATPVLAVGNDYGDAPTSLVSIDAALTNIYASASHQNDGATFLGSRIDSEAANPQSPKADGDDNVGTPNDEDGVTFPMVGNTRALSATTSNILTIKASVVGALNAWIDWNQDGDWTESK